jgi:hypothetical protein
MSLRARMPLHPTGGTYPLSVNPANPIFGPHMKWSPAGDDIVKGHHEVSSCLGIRLIAEIYGVRHSRELKQVRQVSWLVKVPRRNLIMTLKYGSLRQPPSATLT